MGAVTVLLWWTIWANSLKEKENNKVVTTNKLTLINKYFMKFKRNFAKTLYTKYTQTSLLIGAKLSQEIAYLDIWKKAGKAMFETIRIRQDKLCPHPSK